MNAATRAAIASTPIPVEAGIVVRAVVTSIEDRWTIAFAHEGGRRLEPVGEPFTHVRDACAAAEALNARGQGA